MKVHNQSSEVIIEEDLEVKRNLVRTKGAEAIEKAQLHCDNKSYVCANDCLSDMENMCDDFMDDAVIINMKENISKQKVMVNNEKNGRRNSMNMKAYTKNMRQCWDQQESSPMHNKAVYQNKSKAVRSNMLKNLISMNN